MPDTMVDTETIKDAVILACCAPSLQNSEPWRWVLEGERLELFVDTHRVVRRTDRGAVISGGEALPPAGGAGGRGVESQREALSQSERPAALGIDRYRADGRRAAHQ